MHFVDGAVYIRKNLTSAVQAPKTSASLKKGFFDSKPSSRVSLCASEQKQDILKTTCLLLWFVEALLSFCHCIPFSWLGSWT